MGKLNIFRIWNQLKKRTYLLMLVPALFFYSTFVAMPFIQSILYSFTEWSGVGTKNYIGFKNYIELFTDPYLCNQLYNALTHNAILFAVNMLAIIGFGIGVAFILSSERVKGTGFFKVTYFLPYMLPLVVVGYLWRFILNPNFGLINSLLKGIGLGFLAKPWLGSTNFALPAVIFVNSWKQTGMYILFFLAAIISIPKGYHDAAKIDGCNRIQEIIYVDLPLLKPTILTLTILNFIFSFKAFSIVFALTGSQGGPWKSTDMLALFFYRSAFGTQANPLGIGMGMGATIGVVIFVLILLVTLLLTKVRQRMYVEY